MPCNTVRGVGTRPTIVELCIVASVKPPGSLPRQPTIRLDDIVNETLNVDGLGVLLPWPTQVGFELCLDRQVGLVSRNGAVLENQARQQVAVGPAGGSHDALLVFKRPSDEDQAILVECLCVPEDKVDGTSDGAVAIELPIGMAVQGVLVTIKLAVEEGSPVTIDNYGHSLVFSSTSGVLKSNVLESVPPSLKSCKQEKYNESHSPLT